MIRRAATQLATYNPDMTNQVWLGTLGHVSQLKYGHVMPGGCDSLSCTISTITPRRYRAFEAGRVVRGFRGGSWLWEGILQEPEQISGGWNITAFGSGQYGDHYQSNWNLNTSYSADPLNFAIGRGLRWVNHGVSSAVFTPTNFPDKTSQSMTDWANELTQQAGMLWYVGRWNIFRTFAVPNVTTAKGGVPPPVSDGVAPVDFTPATRLIVLPTPPARTVAGHINKLFYKYQSGTQTSGANSGQPIFSFSAVDNTYSQGYWGHFEAYLDMSQAGVLTATAASNNASYVMNKFDAISYAKAITVSHNRYLTAGGQPVDLGAEQAGPVARLLVADSGQGGDIQPAPSTFVVGHYEYDDDAQTADITPLVSYRHDLGTLLAYRVPKLRS